MGALDRRVPVAGVTLAGSLAGLVALPKLAQTLVLVGLPVALIWLVRTTISHARSFEDLLRRIESIEREVNGLAGRDLLLFQSRHPRRGRTVGGRTGSETVLATLLMAGLFIGACLVAAISQMDLAGGRLAAYGGFLALTVAYLGFLVVWYLGYSYTTTGD